MGKVGDGGHKIIKKSRAKALNIIRNGGDVERFVVVVENDELILRKTYVMEILDEIVKRETPPISSKDLDSLIHEIRK